MTQAPPLEIFRIGAQAIVNLLSYEDFVSVCPQFYVLRRPACALIRDQQLDMDRRKSGEDCPTCNNASMQDRLNSIVASFAQAVIDLKFEKNTQAIEALHAYIWKRIIEKSGVHEKPRVVFVVKNGKGEVLEIRVDSEEESELTTQS